MDDPDVRAAFGEAKPPEVPPTIMCVLAGIRGGKSQMAAAKAIQMSQVVNLDVSWVSPGDLIRIPIVSLKKDTALAVYQHVLGTLESSPSLRKLLVGKPTAESIWVRHPSGRPIEIHVSVLGKAGGTLVSRWLAGAIFDECPRMASDDESKKGLEQNMSAITGRILPGCQQWLIGSPWAPFGPAYQIVQDHFGQPSKKTVVVRGKAYWMNPAYWTRERCEELRANDPVAYRTDVECEFCDAEDGIFSSIELDAATRDEPSIIAPVKGQHYVAAMDPATRGNAGPYSSRRATGSVVPADSRSTASSTTANGWAAKPAR